MPRSRLIAICLIFLGAYGVLYAIHAGRSASIQAAELESQIMDVDSKINNLESDVESVKSMMENLE